MPSTAGRHDYVRSRRLRIPEAKVTIGAQLCSGDKALEKYSTAVGTIDPDTLSVPEILQKVPASVERADSIQDKVRSSRSELLKLLQEFPQELPGKSRTHWAMIHSR